MERVYVKMGPLTSEEREFAERNYSVFLRVMSGLRINQSEYYGVAAMGYLKAVRTWFNRQDFREAYKFSTIARQNIRSCVSHERKAEQREVQTVSLDDIIPGTDGCTYGETITYDNILKEDNMNIRYNVTIPERRRLKSDETIAIEGFIAGKMKNMCFEYDTLEEAKTRAASISSYRRKNEHQNLYEHFRIEKTIYITRKGGKN